MNMAFTFPSKIIRHYVAHPCLSLLSLLGLSLALMEIIQIGPMPLLPAMLYGVLAVSFVLLPVINDQTCWAIIVGLRVKMCVWLGVSRGLDLAFLNAD